MPSHTREGQRPGRSFSDRTSVAVQGAHPAVPRGVHSSRLHPGTPGREAGMGPGNEAGWCTEGTPRLTWPGEAAARARRSTAQTHFGLPGAAPSRPADGRVPGLAALARDRALRALTRCGSGQAVPARSAPRSAPERFSVLAAPLCSAGWSGTRTDGAGRAVSARDGERRGPWGCPHPRSGRSPHRVAPYVPDTMVAAQDDVSTRVRRAAPKPWRHSPPRMRT